MIRLSGFLALGMGTPALAQVPDVGGATLSGPAALAAPQVNSFAITGFEVVDEGRLTPQELTSVKALLNKYAGATRSIQDVIGARRAVQAQLDSSRPGQFTVVLPEQTMTAGQIRVLVVKSTQRTLAAVTPHAARGFEEQNLLRSLPALQKGQPINVDRLTTELTMANTNPLKRTRVALTPQGDSQVDATITAEAPQGNIAGYVSVDNFGPAGARGRVTAGVLNANLTGRDDVLNLGAIVAQKPSSQSALSGTYTLPLYAQHAIVELSGVYSKSNPGNVSIFNINGSGTIAKVKLTQILPSLFGNDDTRISADYQYHHSDNQVYVAGFRNTDSLVPSASTAPISVGLESVIKVTPDWTSNLGVRLAHNSAGALGSSSAATLSSLRAGAGSYTLLSGILGVTGQVSDWQLASSLQVQWTKDALIPIDQINIAGPFAVRGFVNAALLGDKAAILRSEVSAPNIALGDVGIRPYGFYDVGTISRNHALAGELTGATVSSAGLGLRAEMFKKVSVDLYVARKLSGTAFDAKSSANSVGVTALVRF